MQVASHSLPPHVLPEPLDDGPRFDAPAARVEPWPEHFTHEGIDVFLWRMTEECIEDMVAAQHERAPSEGDLMSDHRSSMRAAEARLFAQIDAALALGPALLGRLDAQLPELADPETFFAHVLLTGCLALPHSIVLLESAWRASLEHDAEIQEAVLQALCLGSHPETAALARKLLSAGEAQLAVGAARVLAYRSDQREAQILLLLTAADPLLRRAALEAMRHPSYGVDDWQPRLHELLHDEDEGVAWAALRLGVLKRAPEARRRALALCEAGRFAWAEAALHLALAGEEQDLPRFVEWLSVAPQPALLRACARFGASDLVAPLIACLGSSEPDVPHAAAKALARILGDGPRETRSVPLYEEDEKEFVDDPDAMQEVEGLALTPEGWKALWESRQKAQPLGQRYCMGAPYGAEPLLRLLEDGPAARAERRLVQLELCILSGPSAVHMEVGDWLARQDAAIGRWRAALAGAQAPRRGFIRART